MLRIPCSCGKDLKVAESLVGRKIKCPACGAVQVARDPVQTVMTAGSRTSPDSDIDFASPPAGKKGKDAKTAPDPKQGAKKPAKKGGFLKWLVVILFAVLLLGGGTVAGLYFGANIKVWEWVLGSSAKTPVRGSKGTGQKANKSAENVEPVAIKLFVPHKVGEKREVVSKTELKVEFSLEGADVKDEMNAAIAEQNQSENVEIAGLVETLEVNEKGEEVKTKVTIKQLQVSSTGKKAPKEPVTLPPGTVLTGVRTQDKWQWSGVSNPSKELSSHLSDLLSPSYFKESESMHDLLLGTEEKRGPGDSWPVNKEEIAKLFKEKSLVGAGPPKAPVEVEGTGRVVEITSDEGDEVIIELNVKLSEPGKAEKAEMDKKVTLHLPRDHATGPSRIIDKVNLKATFEKETNTLMNMSVTHTLTINVKYLPEEGKNDQPLDKGKDKLPDDSKDNLAQLSSIGSYIPNQDQALRRNTPVFQSKASATGILNPGITSSTVNRSFSVKTCGG